MSSGSVKILPFVFGPVLVSAVLLGTVASAKPCPDQQPRLFPPSDSELPAEGRVIILVRPERSDDLAALEKAKLVLDGEGRAIPLNREKGTEELRSAVGERVLVYRATHVLQPGRTYKLGHLPTLPLAWESLSAARWKAVASSRKPPEIATKKIGRTYCATLASDTRVCGVALQGKNEADVPLLLSGEIKPIEGRAKAKFPTLVDIVIPQGEFALHNQTCAADMAGLPGGKFEATFRLTDAAGRSGQPWKTKIDIRDLNEEMSKLPGQQR